MHFLSFKLKINKFPSHQPLAGVAKCWFMLLLHVLWCNCFVEAYKHNADHHHFIWIITLGCTVGRFLSIEPQDAGVTNSHQQFNGTSTPIPESPFIPSGSLLSWLPCNSLIHLHTLRRSQTHSSTSTRHYRGRMQANTFAMHFGKC